LHVTPHIPIPLTFERPVYSVKTGKSIPLTQYIQELSEEMEKIIEFANREKVDLIVIGNVGLSGLS
jgi:nucleotide-binding universal stress UspA family protein